MRKALVIVCGLLLLVFPELAQATPLSQAQAAFTAEAGGWETQVIELVNSERAKAGLPALQRSSELASAAQQYTGYMAQANFFGHVAPDGSTMYTRVAAAGYTDWSYVAENLGAGHWTPQAVVDAWMASPLHRGNILSPNPSEIGVGYTQGGSMGCYWALEFGSRRDSSNSLDQTPASRGGARTNQAEVLWYCAATNHSVSGSWLAFLKANGGTDNFGYPRSDVISDPSAGGQTTQYFQRVIIEYHPNNPAGFQFQRRLLGDILYPGADAPVSAADAPPGPSTYFPFSSNSPTGLGHFVANYTASSQPTFFKDYFDTHGGVTAFGYPKEEPKLRDGLWTQRFQAAVFEYHPEYDVAGTIEGTTIPLRNFRVQLRLLGDEYIQAKGLGFN